jgi:hypothetical protein
MQPPQQDHPNQLSTTSPPTTKPSTPVWQAKPSQGKQAKQLIKKTALVNLFDIFQF